MSRYAEAVARLNRAQKPSRGVPAYTRYVNRRVGGRIAAAAFLVGLTPNQISLLGGALSLGGFVLLAVVPPSLPMSLAVAALFVTSYALDSADGQLARLRGGGSPVGGWLDHLIDACRMVMLHLAVLVGLYRFTDPQSWQLVIPLAFAVVAVGTFSTTILTDEQLRAAAQPRRPSPGAGSPLRSWLMLPVDFGLVAWVFIVYHQTEVFTALYAFLCASWAAFFVVYVSRSYRELAALQ